MDAELRQRAPVAAEAVPAPNLTAGATKTAVATVEHPSGKQGHGRLMQILRGLSFAVFFFTCIIT